MIRRALATATFLFLTTAVALASLAVGTRAPDFTLPASIGGKVFTFHLADALAKGPVVLYFYPAAFTTGCTIEAHDFAAAMDEYHALGATVIGVSHDTIDTLNRFSVSACRSKFPVAADPQLHVAGQYDAIFAEDPSYASRTSYVIAPDGTVVYAYTNMDPADHVKNTLAAIRGWEASHPGSVHR